jgi:hypothetical protein
MPLEQPLAGGSISLAGGTRYKKLNSLIALLKTLEQVEV